MTAAICAAFLGANFHAPINVFHFHSRPREPLERLMCLLEGGGDFFSLRCGKLRARTSLTGPHKNQEADHLINVI